MDLEGDFDALTPARKYEALDKTQELEEFIKKNNLKFTVFTIGDIIKRKHNIIKRFQDIQAEFEPHTYTHSFKKTGKEEIIKAVKVYKDYFKEHPKGYREIAWMINKEKIKYLNELGFKYDSSISLAFKKNIDPFYYSNTNLLEIPQTVTPILKVPFSISYMQLLGIKAFKLLCKNMPNIIVFDCHLHDLIKTKNYKTLPPKFKLMYARNQLRKDPLKTFKEFIKFIKTKDYKFIHMSELYNLTIKGNVKKIDAETLLNNKKSINKFYQNTIKEQNLNNITN